MQTWPRNPLRKKKSSKSNTKSSSNRRRLSFQGRAESLETRLMLSITAVTPQAISVAEGTVATETATFTASDTGPFTATIAWGDGSVSAGAVSGAASPFTVTGTHTYLDELAGTATVTVSDTFDSTSNSGTAAATISEADTLTIKSTPTIGATEGTAFSSTALATFTTSYAANPTSDFSATIDWGDGSSATAGTVTGSAGTLTVGGTHLYTDELAAGTTATVLLSDDSPGTATAVATGTAAVSEADTLTALTTPAISATEGTTFTSAALATFSSSYASNAASDFTATIAWGDGSMSAGTVTGTGAALTVGGTHLYTDEMSAGTTATVLLSDGSPGTATAVATGTAAVSEADTLTAAATAVTATATANSTFTGHVATFTTSYTANPTSDFSAVINWGDGASSTVTGAGGSITGSGGTLSVTGSHVYTTAGPETATVVLHDEAPGTASATTTATITVSAPAAATITPVTTPTISATEGTAFSSTAVATFSDTDHTAVASDFTAAINWGDGSSATAGTVTGSAGTFTVGGSHLYSDELATGTATVTLTETTPNTATGVATGTASAAEADTLTAVSAPPISTTEGATATATAVFAATGYLGNAPSDFSATINWGDGSSLSTVTPGGTLAAMTVSGTHVYKDEGAFTVTITATDDAPGTAMASLTANATVAEGDALTAGPSATYTVATASPFSGTVATFSNTGYPANPASDFTAEIHWGDGNSSAGAVSLSGGTLTVQGTHTYAATGTDTATVVISDDSPGTASATATATFTVASTAVPVITAVSGPTITATEGTTFSSTAVATFSDTDGSAVASDFTATINWGDGSSATAGTVTGSAGSFTVGGSHLYADEVSAGAASVVLTQTTPSTATGTATGTAGAAEADVLAAGTAVTATATENGTFSGTVATFTNTGYPTNPASDFTATINWGDSTSSTGTVSLASGTLTVAGSHVYSTTGTETVTIVLKDDAPGTASATATATITVSAPAPAPVLTIAKTGTPATIAAGGTETYTVTISNTGNLAATTTAFTDTLPAGETFVSATDSLGGTVTNTNGTLSEAIGSLAASATDTITIVVTVGSSLAGTTVTNTASVSATNFNGGVAITSAFPITVSTTTVVTGVGFLSGVPGDGTEQTFVRNLYRELLGREPDSSGEAFWLSYLSAHDNAAGRQQVIQAFMNSPEYAIHYITTAYNVILHRAPDAGGLAFWTGKMGQPGTPGQNAGSADEKFIIAALYGSDEFYLDSGSTPQGWINALYMDILGRPADGGGLTFWTNELKTRGAGDRDGIVRDLLTTKEAAHDLLDSFYPAAGGTASTPLTAPGTTAGTGMTELALLTGAGWENLYLEGAYGSSPQGNDGFFASLAGNGNWDDIQLLILESGQFYSNANRPVTS